MSGPTPPSPVSVILFDIPGWLDKRLMERYIESTPDVIQVRGRNCVRPSSRYDLVFDFEAGTDVFEKLKVPSNEPFVTIDHHERKFTIVRGLNSLTGFEIVSEFHHSASDGTTRLVVNLDRLGSNTPECYICRSEIEGPFSTPCWSCQSPQCYDCIKAQFRTALKDFQTFPAKCCELTFHPDVAKGILPDDEHAKYKARFEEWLAKQPIYCPIPSCSAFIPSRLIKLGSDNTFQCHVCHVSICANCKKRTHPIQSCEQVSKEDGTMDMIRNFGYKQCPKCGTAIAKMFGCSHVLCSCGAHWCWECNRKIEICNRSPCEGTLEDFEDEFIPWEEAESDIDSVAESDGVRAHDEDSVRTEYQQDVPLSPVRGAAVIARHAAMLEEFESQPIRSRPMVSISFFENMVADMMDAEEARRPVPTLDANGNRVNAQGFHVTAEGFLINRDGVLTTADGVPVPDDDEDEYHDTISKDDVPVSEADLLPLEDIPLTLREPEETNTGTRGQPSLRELHRDRLRMLRPMPWASTTTPGSLDNSDAATANPGPEFKPEPEPEQYNLDDPRRIAWEYEGLALGDEPRDDDPLDVWGCLHKFHPVTHNKVPRHYMTASIPDWWERDVNDRHIECMVCWRPTKVAVKHTGEDNKEDEEKEKSSRDWRFARRCNNCNLIVCRKCKNELIKSDA